MRERSKISITVELLEDLLSSRYLTDNMNVSDPMIPADRHITNITYDPDRNIVNIYLDGGFQVSEGQQTPNAGYCGTMTTKDI